MSRYWGKILINETIENAYTTFNLVKNGVLPIWIIFYLELILILFPLVISNASLDEMGSTQITLIYVLHTIS